MMNRSVFQSSPLMQKMMEGSSTAATGWWNANDNGQIQVLPSSSPSLASIPYHCPFPSFPWHDTQDLQESWSQLLLGGLVEEDGRCNFNTLSQTKKMENNYWEDQVLLLESSNAQMVDVKQERYERRRYLRGHGKEQTLSSPATNKGDLIRHPKLDNSSKCNSTGTGSALKKARMGGSYAQSSFKVRKEKLGDRITALHQLVSPFGKTDTASVLLEVIGYIRFLQTQIEALSSPYLRNGTSVSKTRNIECGISEERKDLKSSGLCLVPISFTMHVASDNGVDYWSPTLAVMFQ